MPLDRRSLRAELQRSRLPAKLKANTGKEDAQNVSGATFAASLNYHGMVHEEKYRALAERLGLQDGLFVIGEGSRGRGLFASRDCGFSGMESVISIPLKETVLCVPDSAPESVSFARKLYAQAQLPEPLAEFAECTDIRHAVRLAVLLHWEIQHGPHGELYAATLPAREEYSNALLLPSEAIDEFQDERLQEMVMKVRSDAESWHKDLFRNLHLQAQPDLIPELQDFFLSLTHVMTRTFVGQVGKGNVAMMVPFCDLVNHDFHPCCNFELLPKKMHFQIYTRQPVSSGEEFCIAYGEELNSYELQVRYGFVVPGNPNDCIGLPSEIGEQAAESSSGMSIDSKQLQKAAKDLCETRHVKDPVARKRIRCVEATLKAARWTVATSHIEAAAMAARAYEACLASSATTIEDDEKLLDHGGLQGPYAAAVRFRLERKLLMRAALNVLEQVLNEYN